MAVFFVQSFCFEQDTLIMKSLLREKIIHPDKIDFLQGTKTSLEIISRDRYSVSIRNLIEGLPSFILAFQNWRHHLPEDVFNTLAGKQKPEGQVDRAITNKRDTP
jgi:hypothetical protein